MVYRLLRKELTMIDNNYCAFSKDHKCIQWMDYELTRHELAAANELCHGNWIEIQHLREYIDVLHGIEIPVEY